MPIVAEPFNQEQLEFHGYTLQTVLTGGDPYYVVWKDGDVISRGSLDTIMLTLQGSDLRKHIPRDWEPAGYEDV